MTDREVITTIIIDRDSEITMESDSGCVNIDFDKAYFPINHDQILITSGPKARELAATLLRAADVLDPPVSPVNHKATR